MQGHYWALNFNGEIQKMRGVDGKGFRCRGAFLFCFPTLRLRGPFVEKTCAMYACVCNPMFPRPFQVLALGSTTATDSPVDAKREVHGHQFSMIKPYTKQK